jgi:hypothetical protein
MMKSWSLFFLLTVLSFGAFAQIEKHAQWKFTVSKSALKIGETLEIIIEADIDEGWYLYSTDYDPNLDAPHASITFEGTGFKESGTVKAIGAKEKFDEIWGGNIKIFTGKGTFKQKLIITKSDPQITVNVDGQACSHVSGLCVRVREIYSFNDIKASGLEISALDTGKIKTPVKANPNPAGYSSARLKELEKAKQSIIKKDPKGRDETREYLKDYVRQNGGSK